MRYKNKNKADIFHKHLKNLSTVDYNKIINMIGKSIQLPDIELETLLINVIESVSEIRHKKELVDRERALEILKECNQSLGKIRW
jgi:hypothetical protein